MVKIYTDGGCRNNGKPNSYGSWAFVAVNEEVSTYQKSGMLHKTTNNRCEMMAVLQAIKYSKTLNEKTVIISDSSYCIDIINRHFNTGFSYIHTNTDYWSHILAELQTAGEIVFLRVKGHSGNRWNTLADQLCTKLLKGVK